MQFGWSLNYQGERDVFYIAGVLPIIINLRTVTARHSHLPQRLSLRSRVLRVVFAMLSNDATGGWQVAAGRGGP